jgi:hypothetical protein
MKKIFISMGLAAGAASLSALMAHGADAGATPKIWNVSASLRGFYDDNYLVAHNKVGSFGAEVAPSVSANVDLQQTDIGVRYTFGMYYYQQRQDTGQDALDYTHQGDFWLDHSFSERCKLSASDALAIGQDPQLVQGGAVVRVKGNNLANRAKATLKNEWTRQFSTATYYGNDYFSYADNAASSPGNPSEAALLNRMEQNVGIDLQWHFQPETMGFVGYNFRWVRYDGNQLIDVVGPINYYSNSRDYDAHYAYVGVSHEFSPNLSAQIRGGVSYVDSYNDPAGAAESWAPYADVSATYTYLPGCYLQGGLTQNINSTDEFQPGANGHLTQYQQSTAFYLDLNHRFTPKLAGSLVSQYIYSSYENGAYSSGGDNAISVGINFSYQINRHFSAEAGYNFDELSSDVPVRSYDRNRVYIGLSANY